MYPPQRRKSGNVKRFFIPIVIIIISLGLIAGYVSSQWTSYHDFEDKCLDCHITIPQKDEKPRTFTKDVSFMCTRCHKEEQELSHPVDLKPSMPVPAAFPLDWKGDITCLTCHPAHQRGFGGSHLRTNVRGEGFCSMCHNDLENEMHKISIGTAHVTRTTGTKDIPWETGIVLDELSLKCLACHDAIFAKESLVDNRVSADVFHNSNQIGVSHPIGISYIEAKRKYQGAYRQVKDLPSAIKLFGGMVGCGSCHNPYSKQHFDLVMSNEGSRLCLACHVK